MLKKYNSDYKSIILKTLKSENSYYLNKDKMNIFKKSIHEIDFFGIKETSLNDINIFDIIKDEDTGDELVKQLEVFEFYKPYFYGIMYTYTGNIEKAKIVGINKMEVDSLFNMPKSPKLIEDEEFIYLKFSLVITSKDESNSKIKYPVVCKFNKKENYLVIFFDTLKETYQEGKVKIDGKEINIYSKIMDQIEKWISKNINIKLSYHPTFKISSVFSDTVKERDDLEEFTEYLNDKSNGNRKLRADINGELPFFGKFDLFIDTLPDEKSKEMVKKFLEKYKKTCDFYQRGFRWLFEHNKNLKVEFKRSIFNDARDLIHFHSHCLESRRVDYVIRDIIEASRIHTTEKNTKTE